MRWVMSDAFAAGDQLNPSAWVDSYRSLVDVERGEPTVGDLEVLAVAAHLIGDDDVSADAWERAVNRHLDAGDRAEAARCSFWSALMLMLKGRTAHASGRLGRADQMMGEDVQGVASGYLLIPVLLGALEAGDADGAVHLAARARAIGVVPLGDPARCLRPGQPRRRVRRQPRVGAGVLFVRCPSASCPTRENDPNRPRTLDIGRRFPYGERQFDARPGGRVSRSSRSRGCG